MNPSHIIARKRDGHPLEAEEIQFFIEGFTNGSIPDYQMSALAMAIYFQDMTSEETAVLTRVMLDSGESLEWPAGHPPIVDKHSTGGIGDKVSLVLAPLLACSGLQVPMISGRGLGPTGGTLDKLESIPGFRTDLSLDEMQTVVNQVGCVISGASPQLAPADQRIYALRDVTATVPSIPLITASIMSKKLAEGLDALVLDVKVGSGAFMKTMDQARALADSLVRTGQQTGLKVSALLTDMNQPLGRMVGNALEIDESIAALAGEGPSDLMEVTFALCGELLQMAGKTATPADGVAVAAAHVESGEALEKFQEMVAAQGGDLHAPREVAPMSKVTSSASGFVSAINTEQLGRAIIYMGGGREKQGDRLDHGVGLEMLLRIADPVTKGQPIANLFARGGNAKAAGEMVKSAVTISERPADALKLITEKIS